MNHPITRIMRLTVLNDNLPGKNRGYGLSFLIEDDKKRIKV